MGVEDAWDALIDVGIDNEQIIEARLPPPKQIFLDDIMLEELMPTHIDSFKLSRGEAPLHFAWRKLTWRAARNEVQRRWPRGHVEGIGKHPPKTMPELYTFLHEGHNSASQDTAWLAYFNALTQHLDIELRKQRTQSSHGIPHRTDIVSYTSFLIWQDLVEAVQKVKPSWNKWRMPNANATASVVKFSKQIRDFQKVPMHRIEETSPGQFKWGDFVVECADKETAAEQITQQYATRLEQHKDVLEMSEADKLELWGRDEQCSSSARAHELRHTHYQVTFRGRLWDSGNKWFFEEDFTGIKVHVELPDNVPAHNSSVVLNQNLYKSLRAEHIERDKKQRVAVRKAQVRQNVPTAAGHMKVIGADTTGKIKYGWEDEVILVTPRSLRAEPGTDESRVTHSRHRELTPDRALRKMKDKVRRSVAQAALGKHSPIVVTHSEHSTAAIDDTMETVASTRGTLRQDDAATSSAKDSPTLVDSQEQRTWRSLADDTQVQYVRDAFEFLNTASLFHCGHCDEEWIVFTADFPTGGVDWVGPVAGKCETIDKAGFRQSWRKPHLCGRCGDNN